MIRPLSLLIPVLGAVACSVEQPSEQEKTANLILQITAQGTQGQRPPIEATITNQGKTAVHLVLPGDGSDCGWRTPVIGWSIIKVGKEKIHHPATPSLLRGGRCGNINALKKNEIFLLAPGESKKLNDWIAFPQLAESGTYSVKFYYANDPALKWKGIPLGQHDPQAMTQVQESYKCSLVSNELTLAVQLAKDKE